MACRGPHNYKALIALFVDKCYTNAVFDLIFFIKKKRSYDDVFKKQSYDDLKAK